MTSVPEKMSTISLLICHLFFSGKIDKNEYKFLTEKSNTIEKSRKQYQTGTEYSS